MWQIMQMSYISQYRSSFHFPLLSFVRKPHELQVQDRSHKTPPPQRRNHINLVLIWLVSVTLLVTAIHLITPALANSLADNLPRGWVRASSMQMLTELDNSILQASNIPLSEQDALAERFGALRAAPEGAPAYRLLFRHNTVPGVTMLTLPGGEIIVTDEFMQTITDKDEQLALLCHELGHLYYRHALRNAIENNLYWLATAAFTGSSEGSIQALATGLRQSEYTRSHVLEADRYAVSMLRANQMPVRLLSSAIRHAEETARAQPDNKGLLSHREYFGDRMMAIERINDR